MIPVDEIVAYLKTVPDISGIVAARVADYDIRRDKNKAYFDQVTGDVLPCLICDDIGELAIFGTHTAMAQDVFYVWALAPLTSEGRWFVRDLMVATRTALDGWQASTRQLVQYTRERVGIQGASITDGVLDRMTFRCIGVHAGATS